MAEVFDLVTAVIDVEFAGDVVAGEGKQGSNRIPHRRDAGVAKMEIPRRVGGDVFHVDGTAFFLAAAIVIAFLDRFGDDALEGLVFQEEIEEARAGDFHAVEHLVLEMREQAGGQIDRFATGQTAKAHRRVGGIITVGGIFGVLDDDILLLQRQTDFGAGFLDNRLQ